jgi:hypothetical protein
VSRHVVRLVTHDVGKYSIWRLGATTSHQVIMLHHAVHGAQPVVVRLYMFCW